MNVTSTTEPIQQTTEAATRPSRIGVVILVLSLLGLGVRFWQIDEQALTNDEVVEVEDARESWYEITMCPDDFPPLYRYLLTSWIYLTGSDELARWPSALIGAACVPLMFYVGFQVGGYPVAVCVGLMTALSPLLIHYSQEARAYGLYLVLAAGILAAYIRALRTDKLGSWLAFAALAAIINYVHYFGLFLTLTLGVGWLIDRQNSEFGYKRGIIATGLIILGCLPILTFLQPDLTSCAAYLTPVPASLEALGFTFYSYCCGYGLGPSLTELHEMPVRQAITSSLPWILVALSIFYVPLLLGLRSIDKQLRPTMILLLIVPVTLTALVAMVMDINYNVRYVVYTLLPCLILVSVGICNMRSRGLQTLALFAIVLVFACSHHRRITVAAYQNEDVRNAARYLMSQQEQYPATIVSDYMARPLRYYLDDKFTVVQLPEQLGFGLGIEDEDQLQATQTRINALVEEHGGAWIVLTRAFHGDPFRLLRNWIESEETIQHEVDFAGVQMYLARP